MPNPAWVRLADGLESFYAVRQQLSAGGLGRIEALYTEPPRGITPPVNTNLADPDGLEIRDHLVALAAFAYMVHLA
jgi:hypothetical protein